MKFIRIFLRLDMALAILITALLIAFTLLNTGSSKAENLFHKAGFLPLGKKDPTKTAVGRVSCRGNGGTTIGRFSGVGEGVDDRVVRVSRRACFETAAQCKQWLYDMNTNFSDGPIAVSRCEPRG